MPKDKFFKVIANKTHPNEKLVQNPLLLLRYAVRDESAGGYINE